MSRVKERVVVAMSGGVDSSMAAYFLKEKGYEVIGATMCIGPMKKAEKGPVRCCGLSDIEDAQRVALQLGISFYVIQLREEFERDVIQYFCQEYRRGRTPNPCILCNERIKFGSFWEKAKALGADLVASGHYARLIFDEVGGRYLLRKGMDQKKDQSYVLFSLTQDQFRHSLFPLGEFRKETIRQRAFHLGLRVHNKPESQEICFIHDSSYHSFLSEKIEESAKPGPIIDQAGNILGSHKGIPFYTIGQRRGLRLAKGKPLYVIGIDRAKNAVIVGGAEEVYSDTFIAESINWIFPKEMTSPLTAQVKIRYNHPGSEAILSLRGRNEVEVKFKAPQKAITPGQAAVFYDGDTVLGGGWIKEIVKS
jgi:tRNA-specific 2-thiouridylase